MNYLINRHRGADFFQRLLSRGIDKLTTVLVHWYRQRSVPYYVASSPPPQAPLPFPSDPSPTPSIVASALGGMFLEEQIRRGRTVSIPSLGIEITHNNLPTMSDTSSNSLPSRYLEQPQAQYPTFDR